MNSRTIRVIAGVAGAVAVAAGVAAWLLWPKPVALPVDAAVDAVATVPTERPGLPPRDQPGSGAITLAGTVIDAIGTAVAGAEVTAELELGPGVDSLAPGATAPDGDAGPGDAGTGLVLSPAVVAIADDQGAFSLVGLEPGRYRLRVEAPDIFTAEVRFFDVPADGVRLVVARKVSVRGKVVDGAGQAVAGVQVHAMSDTASDLGTFSVTTDALGAFVLDELQQGVFKVWAIHGTMAAPALRVSRLETGPFDEVLLGLVPAQVVTGRVVDKGSGRGVAALVTLAAADSDEPPRRGHSEADGIFRLDGVLPGRWSAHAYAPGYVAVESVEFAAGGFEPVIEMTAGGVIEGRVVDKSGVAVAGAVVSARGVTAAGRWHVASESAEVERVRRARGMAATVAGLEAAAAADSRFLPRGELGVLLGPIPFPPPKGAAALRIAQRLQTDNEPVLLDLPVSPAAEPRYVTDEQGRFRITGLAPGTYRVLATHAGYADALSKPWAVALGQEITGAEVVMVPGVMVAGLVQNQRGEPVVGATVLAITVWGKASVPDVGAGAAPGDESLRLQAVTGPDGRYELGPIAADVQMQVSAVHHGQVERALVLGELSATRQERVEDFVLPVADATLAGRVRDGVSFPVRGALVTVHRPGKGDSPGPSLGRQAVTDEHGAFRVDFLPPGAYVLVIEHPDFPRLLARADTAAEAEVALPFGGGILGEIRDVHTGAPLVGARVLAAGPGQARVDTAAGEGGAMELVPLAVGSWTLEVSAPGYVPARQTVAVTAGARPREITVKDLKIVLERGATLGGTVRDQYGVRVRGARVSAGAAATTTDEHGAFLLRDVATGDIRLVAEHDGASGAVPLSVRPGDEFVTLEIALEPAAE